MSDFNWTAEQVELLIKLWKAGISSGEIAKRFGISRSAVMGKVGRMNLTGIERDTPPGKKKKKRPEHVRKRHPVILIHLKKDGCLFAVTPDHAQLHWFCNEPRLEGSSYCRRHHSRCYNHSRASHG